VSPETGTVVTTNRVGTVSILAAVSVVYGTLIHVCASNERRKRVKIFVIDNARLN